MAQEAHREGGARAEELGVRRASTELGSALEICEGGRRTSRQARAAAGEDEASESRPIFVVPADAERTAELLDGIELLDRLARPAELVGKLGKCEARLYIAWIGDHADREVATRFDRASLRHQRGDIDRCGRAHTTGGDEQHSREKRAHCGHSSGDGHDLRNQQRRCSLCQWRIRFAYGVQAAPRTRSGAQKYAQGRVDGATGATKPAGGHPQVSRKRTLLGVPSGSCHR